MIYCFFTLTIGQFIPIYFDNRNLNSDFKESYYLIILTLILISTTIVAFKRFYKPQQNRRAFLAWFSALIIGAGTCCIFALIVLFNHLAVLTDMTTLYVKKGNRNIKIVTRYLNEGAFGGGTKPEDYEVVLKREINPFLKIETSIDTNTIDKTQWIKISHYPGVVYPDL